MALPVQIGKREYDKFVVPISGATGSVAVVVANPDGTTIGGATTYIGTSMVTVTMGTALNSSIDSISVVPTGNVTLNPSNAFIGLVTSVIGSAPTLFAVTNSSNGNVTLNPSPNFIGLTTSVIGSAPTLFAVVNTGASTGNVTLNPSPNFIGLATIVHGGALAAGTNFIGLATVVQGNQPALVASSAYVGLASVNIGGTLPALTAGSAYVGLASVNIGGTLPALTAGSAYVGLASVNIGGTLPALSTGTNFIGLTTTVIGSAPTLFAVTNSSSGNVTLNPSPNFIGLATVVHGGALAAGTNFIGLVTTTQGNQPALTASSAYIGLASVNIGGTLPALTAGSAYVGLASVNIGGTLPALSAGTAFIGLATVTQGNQPALVASSAYIGLASVNIGGTLPALSTGTAFIGLTTTVIGSSPTIFAVVNTGATNSNVTLNPSPNFIGLVTAVIASSATLFTVSSAFTGNVTLNASNAFIGLATVVQGSPPWQIIGNATGGLADSGNPVKVGGIYNVSVPTLDDLDRGDLQLDVNGYLRTREQYAPVYEDNTNGIAAVLTKPVVSSIYSGSVFTGWGATICTNIRNAPAQLLSISASNAGATIRYLQIFNVVTGVSSATTPVYSFPLPSGTGNSPGFLQLGKDFFGDNGYYLSTGLTWGISSTATAFNGTDVVASQHLINGIYM